MGANRQHRQDVIDTLNSRIEHKITRTSVMLSYARADRVKAELALESAKKAEVEAAEEYQRAVYRSLGGTVYTLE